MKKTLISRLSKLKAGNQSTPESWHNGGDTEICFYARSLQNAAKNLVAKLEVDRDTATAWDAGPVVLLYRQALEIHLKLLVGEGSNFLPSPIGHITLYKTHSSRWLAQIVCQIIRKVGWEGDFTREGVSSLADFSAFVNEVESFDPIARAIRFSRDTHPNSVSEYYRTFDVVQFAKTLDGLLDLLDVTSDALAAAWDQRAGAAAGAPFDGGDDFKPTIQ